MLCLATDVTYAMWRDNHTTHFSSSTAISNGSERERYSLVRMRDKVQGQCVLSGFALRTLTPLL